MDKEGAIGDEEEAVVFCETDDECEGEDIVHVHPHTRTEPLEEHAICSQPRRRGECEREYGTVSESFNEVADHEKTHEFLQKYNPSGQILYRMANDSGLKLCDNCSAEYEQTKQICEACTIRIMQDQRNRAKLRKEAQVAAAQANKAADVAFLRKVVLNPLVQEALSHGPLYLDAFASLILDHTGLAKGLEETMGKFKRASFRSFARTTSGEVDVNNKKRPKKVLMKALGERVVRHGAAVGLIITNRAQSARKQTKLKNIMVQLNKLQSFVRASDEQEASTRCQDGAAGKGNTEAEDRAVAAGMDAGVGEGGADMDAGTGAYSTASAGVSEEEEEEEDGDDGQGWEEVEEAAGESIDLHHANSYPQKGWKNELMELAARLGQRPCVPGGDMALGHVDVMSKKMHVGRVVTTAGGVSRTDDEFACTVRAAFRTHEHQLPHIRCLVTVITSHTSQLPHIPHIRCLVTSITSHTSHQVPGDSEEQVAQAGV